MLGSDGGPADPRHPHRRLRAPISLVALVLVLVLAAASCARPRTGVPAGPNASEGCSSEGSPPTSVSEGTFDDGGIKRLYNLEYPEKTDRKPLPMVVNIHGALANAKVQDTASDLPAKARQRDLAVLSPQGGEGTYIWNLDPAGADVAFILSLIERVERDYCIDNTRVFLTGFSMGGMMSVVLACLRPDLFAGAAPVAGLLDPDPCAPHPNVALLAFQGTADDAVRYDGTYSPMVAALSRDSRVTPRADVAAKWAAANGCTGEPTPSNVAEGVRRFDYSCPAGADTQFYAVDGGGHTWPGSKSNAKTSEVMGAGKTTLSIDASKLILDFFEAQRPRQ